MCSTELSPSPECLFGHSGPFQCHQIRVAVLFCVSVCRHDFFISLSAAALGPTLTVSQSLVTEQRDTAVFYCNTSADDVTIHWVYNNSPLAVNERMVLSADNKTLTILVVQREDWGSYLCEVQRDFSEGQKSDIASLTVNCESSRFIYPLRTPASLALHCVREAQRGFME